MLVSDLMYILSEVKPDHRTADMVDLHRNSIARGESELYG